jgi:uncharacterized protein (TIGR03032 family)
MATEQPINKPVGKITVAASEPFAEWLAGTGGSLVITCYRAGKVALVGWNGQHVSLLLRDFARPLGIAVHDGEIALATREEILLFANAPALAPDVFEDRPGSYDALFLPRVAYHTGELYVHDVGYGADGQPWLVNTRFCCLATLSHQYNFTPRWKPPFVSQIVPEDRCHLNGMAMVDGQPKWVTCLGQTDTAGGWRDGKIKGGVIVHVPDSQVVVRGLSMPHSPRWHDGQLWVLNSGQGQLLRVDVQSGRWDVVCALPGYVRGLCFHGDCAIIGLSQIREKHIFGGMPVAERFERLLCAVAVVDLRSGATVGMFEFTAGCPELYEVQFLAGVRQAIIFSSSHLAARQAFTTGPINCWIRPDDEDSDGGR